MEAHFGYVWALTLVFRAVWSFVIPAMVAVAACAAWRHAPRWISIAFLAYAAIGFLGSIPPMLLAYRVISPEVYLKIAFPAGIVVGAARIVAAAALIALAFRTGRTAGAPAPEFPAAL